ncbi:MAG: hypothetical protein GY754_31660 [bacterium]|nr:hypothetical protein [bacterium]
MRIQKLFFIILLGGLFVSSTLNAQSSDPEIKIALIKWVPVSGAIGYYIELKDQAGKILHKKRSKVTEARLPLSYGEYSYRIGIISKFNKVFKWSEWRRLAIISPDDISHTTHIVGIEAGYSFKAIEESGTYSGSLKNGIFYECHAFVKQFTYIYLGTAFSYYHFIGEASDFTTSWMLKGGVYMGLDYPSYKKEIDGSLFHISPFIGYKHYYRIHTFQDTTFSANRPVLAAGLFVNYDLFEDYLIAVAFEYNRIFDNVPINTFEVYARFGFHL